MVFAGLAWVMPVVIIFASRATVIVLAVAALLLILDGGVRHEIGRLLRSRLGRVFVGLLLWAALTTLWSPRPLGTLYLVIRLVGLFSAGLVLISGALLVARDGARELYRPLRVAGLATVALLAVEWASSAGINMFLRDLQDGWQGNPLNLLNRASVMTTLLVWLAATAMARERRPWGHPAAAAGLLAAGFLVVLDLQMNVVPVALAVSAALWLAIWLAPRGAVRVVATVVAVTAMAAPLLPVFAFDPSAFGDRFETLPASLQHRLYMWSYVADRIFEHPLRGWGLDASRWIEAGHITVEGMTVQLLPLHPHNGVLQIWLELGLPGAVLLAAVVALLLIGLERFSISPAALATGVAVLTCFAIIAAVSYGIWQNWWLAAGWLTAAYTVILAGDKDAAGPKP
jgi:O-antigen ligase